MRVLLAVLLVGIHFTIIANAFSINGGSALKSELVKSAHRFDTFGLKDSLGKSETHHVLHDVEDHKHSNSCLEQRRNFLSKFLTSSVVFSAAPFVSNVMVKESALAKPTDIDSLLSQLKEARAQLEPVPNLIKEEKWDSVRAILITPPLADCWAKTSKPLLKLYAQAQDDLPNGDELTALELREEALDHLRFLDMAVYNNVFNPIKSEGETGATKELIRSYYEDPVNEYKQCIRILDDLITLAK